MQPETVSAGSWWNPFSWWGSSDVDSVESREDKSTGKDEKALVTSEHPFSYERNILEYLLKHTKDPEAMKTIAEGCETFMSKYEEEHLSWARRQLGELFYVATANIEDALEYLKELEEAQPGTETNLDKDIKEFISGVWFQSYEEASKVTSKVTSDVAETVTDVCFSTMIACLLSTTGLLNRALLPVLVEELETHSHPFCKDAGKFLEKLFKDSKVQKLLNTLDIEGECFLDPYIRSSLGEEPDAELDRSHRLIYVLKGLMVPFRQGGDGTCFADGPVYETLSENLPLALSCMEEIIKKGYMSREHQGTALTFPFIPHVVNENSGAIVFTKEGSKTKVEEICKDPQIQGAVSQLGIDKENFPQKYQEALKRIEKERKEESYTVSIGELLGVLAEICGEEKKWTSEEVKQRTNLARLSFTSWNKPILPHFMENCFAGMAEGLPSCRTSSAIIDSTSEVLRELLKKQGEYPEEVKTIVMDLVQFLMGINFRPRYDQCLPGVKGAASGSGGFVLYIPDFLHPEKLGKRVDTPEKFSEAVAWILERAIEVAPNYPIVLPSLVKDVVSSLKELQPCVKKEGFSQAVAEKYPQPQMEGQPPRTPWIDRTGDTPVTEIELLIRKSSLRDHCRICPKNAKDLLEGMINYERGRKEEIQKAIQQFGNPLTPIFVNFVHIFSLSPAWKKFLSGIRSDQTVDDWIAKTIEEPGRAFGQQELPKATMETLASEVVSKWIKEDEVESFWEELNSKIKTSSTISAFGAAVLEVSQGKLKEGITEQTIWLFLSQSLNSWEGKSIQDSMVIVADTNWVIGEKKIKFCFAWGFKGEIVLCQVCEDKSNLMKMDPSVWVNPDKPWNFWGNVIGEEQEEGAGIGLEHLNMKV